MSDPKTTVENFLKENGYPFEMRVASEFQKRGFGIRQSVYFTDPNLNVVREIDVIALWHELFKKKDFTVIFFIECKYAKTPWILFSSLTEGFSRCYLSNIKGINWINHLITQPSFENFFELQKKTGYALTVTTKDNDPQKDNAYKAIQTIMAFLKSESQSPKFSDSDFIFFVPIIAIRGKLFETHLNERNEIECNEINEAQLFYNESISGAIPKIHIVTEEIIEQYIQRIHEDIKRLFIEPYMSISLTNPALGEL
jgi:hypothetical protein